MNLAAQTTPLIAALEQLGPHDHLCSIYESPQEHYAVAIPFIRIGLDRGEKCIYIADDGAVGDVRQAMQSEGIDVDGAIASKALVLATKDQTYLEHGTFHPDWMFTFWKETTELAMSEGFSALRATGETEWVLRGGRGLERWMEYESRLTHTLSESKCSALCQYNRRLFPPEVILDVIRTHPTIVCGSTVCRNLYYVPPEEFLGANQPAREVERLLTNIRERERVDNELREQQADLAHVSRATTLGELTASLAHEVNQPITAAVTNANTCVRWLAGDTPNIQEAREAAMRSAKDGTRAAEIIGRIRLLFEKGNLESELVDINEVIREIIILLRSEAARFSVSVQTELATELPDLMGDRVQLQQVFMNLVLNGIDAMKDVADKRELFIKTERWENEQVLVSVRDNGIGLPPQVDQIFNAFFTTKLHGIGMGLSISRSIVESHHGRLWADGNPTRGATFYIALPTCVEAH